MNRLNYYFRQKVTEGELDLGFTNAEAGDLYQNVDAAQVGVMNGMVVTERGAGANLSVDVSAGVGYDKDGRRIQFSATQNVDVSSDSSAVTTAVAGVGNSKIISVFAKFKRVLTDARTDGNSATVYFSEAESFEFIVRQGGEAVSPSPVALDPAYILLADITRVFGDTTITNAKIDTTATNRREEVFKVAGTPHRLQRGRATTAVSDVLGWLNGHITGSADKHSATEIVAAIAATWSGGAAIVGANVDAVLEEIVTAVAASGGAAKLGGATRAASYIFATSGTTIQGLIDSIAAYLDTGPAGQRVTSYVAAGLPVTLGSTLRTLNIDTTAGAGNVQLPAPVAGFQWTIKDSAGTFGTNPVTLLRAAAEKIEGVAASFVLNAAWGSWTLYSDGTDWFLK